MITAKLIGNVWATRKTELLNGHKLMILEVLGGKEDGVHLVAVDTVDAGIGDRVIVTRGSAARRMLENDASPVDAAIIGIIDKDCVFSGDK
ncbi:MAG: EutN/CcmL family microcompartment protein [Clostridiales Family XIII bacterium]|jgi:ethanolamine utilization protein EutN|nr:EutN/CcmL family microcompartment protein [Clostridiales Family XIII bacterium]